MIVVTNGRVVGPREILEHHCVMIEHGRIREVAPTEQVLWPEDAETIDARGCFIAPGFIDLHVHGGQGRDTMEASVEALAQVAKFHNTGGTTLLTPTTVSDTPERIGAALGAIGQAVGHDFGGARIHGAHVEGPYLSPQHCGIHASQWMRDPEPAEYLAWLTQEEVVTQMTLAPERPGALALIDALLEREILPSAGHTAAGYAEARTAVERGLCQASHVYNHMTIAQADARGIRPGATELFLSDDRVMVELIGDGVHVPPELMKLVVRAKGADKVCLVTDATDRAGTGGSDTGDRLRGGTSTMIQLVRTMVESVGLSVVDAVRLASLNPARALGLNGHKGSLEARKDADLVIFNGGYVVQQTMVGGRVTYAVPPAGSEASP